MSDTPFVDFGLRWFRDIVELITDWFVDELIYGLRHDLSGLFSTPLPEGEGISIIFSEPAESDEIWHSIYESTVAGETMVFALIILLLSVQGHHFVRIFNYGSAYESRKARSSSWIGALLIVTWYWVAVLFLYFVEGLTVGLMPDLQALGDTIYVILPQAAGSPGLTLIMATLGGLSMVAPKALFFIREILIYVYLYGMPFGIAIAYGNVPVLSNIARRLAVQFIPLAILPLPAAILFRGYELLFVGSTNLPIQGDFAQYLVVISLPIIALYVTWKTFKYASPLASRVVSGAGRGVVLGSSAVAAGSLAGPAAGAAAARWGPKAAAGSAFASMGGRSTDGQRHSVPPEGEGPRQGGVPDYRRRENDPGYY